jgi:predicted dehydrogenase
MMGRNHVRVLQALEGVELVGVADPVGDRFGAAAGVPVFAAVEELIEEAIDMCVVAVPTAHHLTAGLMLADAGVHTLVEKPLAQDTPSALRLAGAFEAAGLVGAVGHIERFNPALQSMRQRLEHGELGDIYQIATRRQGPFPHRIQDVGVVKDLATHDIDLTSWVAQSPFLEVAARTVHKSGRKHEDLVAATGALCDGTVTNHLVNWLTPFKEREILVTGERGCFVANTLTADLTFHANGLTPTEWPTLSAFRGVSEGDMIRYAITKQEPLMLELTAFRDAVLGKSDAIVQMRQGLTVVAVAEALIESALTGATVAVQDA